MMTRSEQPGDEAAIRDITARAFETMPYGDGTEPHIIDALRKAGDLTLSLVGVLEDTIVGQVTFSPVTIDGVHDQWFGLGPIAVEPGQQRRGIGSILIEDGLALMKEKGAKGVALLGNPDYYKRFGFKGKAGLTYPKVKSRFVQRLTFVGPDPKGALQFCDAFKAAGRGER